MKCGDYLVDSLHQAVVQFILAWLPVVGGDILERSDADVVYGVTKCSMCSISCP